MATLLLGILLYVVLGIVSQAVDPGSMELDTGDTPENVAPPAINTRTDLEIALKGSRLNTEELIDGSINWYDSRGYLGTLKVFGRNDESTMQKLYRSIPPSELLTLAGAGDIAAAQALAENSMSGDNNNPLEALEWYRQAASYGSVYAMFRISELLRIFADRQLDVFNSDPVYAERLAELRNNNPLIERDALAWALTGILAGGLPVAQADTAETIRLMAEQLGESRTINACDKATRLLLDLAAERRSRDRLVFSTEPPPLFISTPRLANALPCEQFAIPIISTESCKPVSVPGLVNPNQTLWHCLAN